MEVWLATEMQHQPNLDVCRTQVTEQLGWGVGGQALYRLFSRR
jgi:hypothetical protein